MESSDPTFGPDHERSIFLRPAFLAAAAAVVVIAALGAWLGISGGGSHAPSTSAGHHTPPMGSHAAAPGPTPSASAPPVTKGCHLSASNQQVPTTAPAGVTWRLYQTVALPFSQSAGPAIVTGDIARCYAHTPTGALLAEVQISVRYLIAPQWRKVVQAQVVPGPGRTAYVHARAQVNSQAGNRPGQYGQVAAFKFVTHTPQTAVVQLVTKFSDGHMQMTTNTMEWRQGDWELVLQPDGSDSPTVQPVTSLSGFAPWGGV